MNLQILSLIHILALAVIPMVGESATCSAGPENLMETSPSTTSGLYINMEYPAECTGFLTIWYTCYYAPRSNRAIEYQVQLQLWRQDTDAAGSTYIQVGQTTQAVTIPRNQPSNDFQCVEFVLAENEYIPVVEGDLLGIYIPNNNILPVVSNAESPTQLHYFEPAITIPTVVSLSQQSLRQGNALHLTAEIVEEQSSTPTVTSVFNAPETSTPQILSPTTTILAQPVPMSMSTTSLPPPQSMISFQSIETVFLPLPSTVSFQSMKTTLIIKTSTPKPTNIVVEGSPKGRGLSDGATAGIVIVVLILLIIVSTAVIMAAVIYFHQRHKKTVILNNAGSTFSLDNATYEVPAPIRANTALFNQLNVYEVPVPSPTPRSRPPHESMYVAMEGSESIQTNHRVDENVFNDSFDDSGVVHSVEDPRYITQDEATQAGPGGIFNIYGSFDPRNPEYNQFMKQATMQNGNQLTRSYCSDGNPYRDPPNEEEEIYKALSSKTRTIPHKDIKISQLIGSGEFAQVSKAIWKSEGGKLEVAVKKLHSNASEMDKIKLLQEAAIMGQFIHPNVVRLHGVVSDRYNIMLVCEYLEKGDLVNTLQQMRPLPGKEVQDNTTNLLLNYCQQIVLGMHYLSSKGFVHRDLAARNVLVSRTNICKIGDFGMSRDLLDADYYVSQGGVVPVRWTAPEAIFFRKYSTDSDIWSYGCVLWEIWSLGSRPYQDIANKTVIELIANGYRLPPPPGCPKVLYDLMIQCWNPFPNSRPSFREILAMMLEEEQTVLTIPKQDAATHKQASQLGADLKAGKKMYQALQNTYVTNEASPIESDVQDKCIDKAVKPKANAASPVVPKRHEKPPIPRNKPTDFTANHSATTTTHVNVREDSTKDSEDEIYDDTVTVKHSSTTTQHVNVSEGYLDENEVYDDITTINSYSSTENLLLSQPSQKSSTANGVHVQSGQCNQTLLYGDYDTQDYDVVENTHATSDSTMINTGTFSEQYYELPSDLVQGTPKQNKAHSDNIYEAI